MALGNTNTFIYAYNFDGTYYEISDLISSMKHTCSLTNVSQQLDITLAYGVYSTAFPSFPFQTGQKLEVYIDGECYFRGKIETVTLNVEKETISITCYDYIRNLMTSKVTYNFSDMSAYDCVAKILTDIEIPFATDGIFDGVNGTASQCTINHKVKNKSAYEACMMIATEVHRNIGVFYYMFMDVSGNVNLMACDTYWSKQIISPCTDPSLQNPDGNMISFTYKQDASDIITKVEIYDSKGESSDISTGDGSNSSGSSGSGDQKVNLSGTTEISMNVSFYTGQASEGGSKAASGVDLAYGMCASNVYSFGTRFYIKGINGLEDRIFTVEDTGSDSSLNSPNRLDIYVGNDSDSVSKANKLGRQDVTAYKLKYLKDVDD